MSRWQVAIGRTSVQRMLQIALGATWLLDGALQLQPYMFQRAFASQIIAPNAVGQPGFIGAPITWAAQLIETHVVVFNAFAATVQLLIGLGLLYRPTVKPALMASFLWALGVWWFGEGLGMLFTGQAAPLTGAPGAVLLYAILGMLLWPGPREPRDLEGGLLGVRGARLAWAALWLLVAALWLLPANRASDATHDAIAAAPSGAHWLTNIQHAAANATSGAGLQIALVMAAISAAVAVFVALGWRPRWFLALACVVSLDYWVLGQGFGGIFTGTATDPNAGPLFVLLAAAMYGMLPTEREARAAITEPAYG